MCVGGGGGGGGREPAQKGIPTGEFQSFILHAASFPCSTAVISPHVATDKHTPAQSKTCRACTVAAPIQCS